MVILLLEMFMEGNLKLKILYVSEFFQIQEHRTHISALNGKIIAENIANTVLL